MEKYFFLIFFLCLCIGCSRSDEDFVHRKTGGKKAMMLQGRSLGETSPRSTGRRSKKSLAIIDQTRALEIAERSREAQALYALQGGKLAGCIDKKVLRPCDSDWVTCIDDAWVVRYSLTDRCPIKSDGRLGVNLLIDARSGAVISRYPEVEYFQEAQYCLEDYDCLCPATPKQGGVPSCVNFIYAPFIARSSFPLPPYVQCACRKNRCVVQEGKSK